MTVYSRTRTVTYPFVLTSLILGLLVAAISSAQASETDPAAPIKLGAVKAAIVELESGKTLYSKHSDWVTPIASITKLMTALVVMSLLSRNPSFALSTVNASTGPSSSRAISRSLL